MFGCVSPPHATQFKAFVKQSRRKFALHKIIKGETSWPSAPEDRDVLYFLSQSFRALIVKELPETKDALTENHRHFAHRAKALLKNLANISLEMAQMVVTNPEQEEPLPSWFLVEVVRDMPRLAATNNQGTQK